MRRRLILYRIEDGSYVLYIELTSQTGAQLSDAYLIDSPLAVYYLLATDIGGLSEMSNRDFLSQAAQSDEGLAAVLTDLVPELVAPAGDLY